MRYFRFHVCFRDDACRCFNSAFFIFYPTGPGDGDSDKFIAYFPHPRCYPNYTEQFHRRLFFIHDSVPVEFIHAHLAHWVINLAHRTSFDSIEINELFTRSGTQDIRAYAAI